MAKPVTRGDRMEEMEQEISGLRRDLDKGIEQWEAVSKQVEEIKKQSEETNHFLLELRAELRQLLTDKGRWTEVNPGTKEDSDKGRLGSWGPERKKTVFLPSEEDGRQEEQRFFGNRRFERGRMGYVGSEKRYCKASSEDEVRPEEFSRAGGQRFNGRREAEAYERPGVGRHFKKGSSSHRRIDWETGFRRRGDWSGMPRAEIPVFEGEGWTSWVKKIERYFRINRVPQENRLFLLSDFLTGKAWDYFEWITEEEPQMSWEELKMAFEQRFGLKEFRSIQEQLMSLRQSGGVEEYGEQFQELAAKIRGMDREAVLGAFINGLSWELRDDVRILQSRNVYEALTLAIRYEYKLQSHEARKEAKWGWETGPIKSPSPFRGNPRPGEPIFQQPETGPIKSSPTIRGSPRPGEPTYQPPTQQYASGNKSHVGNSTISQAERLRRREANLCFQCGEKWEAGHRCKQGLNVLTEVESEEDEEGEDAKEEGIIAEEGPKVSLRARARISGNSSSRFPT